MPILSLDRPRQLAQHLRPSSRAINAGAWFFIAVSLLATFAAFGLNAGNSAQLPVGTVFGGAAGMVMAIGMISVIGAAAIMTLLPEAQLRWRRFGHVAILLWAGVWTIGLVRTAGADGGIANLLRAALMAGLFGCTAVRAFRNWSPARPVPASNNSLRLVAEEPEIDSDREQITAAHISASECMTEVDRQTSPAHDCARPLLRTGLEETKRLGVFAIAQSRHAARRLKSYLRDRGALPHSRAEV